MRMRGTAAAIAVAALAAAATGPAVAAGGTPEIERETFEVTFFDDFIFDLCGVETMTTQTQTTTIKTFPDGSVTEHVNVEFVPDDPSIASERYGRTNMFAPDGTQTIVGLAIRLYRKGEGTIIRDAGWLRVEEDGLVIRGPHPFLETDPATVYC